MKENNNIHNGHRARLTDLVFNVGMKNITNVQAVETFLTYIIPRKDVNPISHALINKFGSFSNIIDADINDLMQIPGISELSAKKIKNFKEIFTFYTYTKIKPRQSIKNSGEFLDILVELLRYNSTENLYIFAIDNALRLLQLRQYNLEEVREVGIAPLEILNLMNSTHASYLAVAHNHPNGVANHSDKDSAAAQRIKEIIQPYNCKFIDSFVVGEDGVYSEEQHAYVRRFDDSNDGIIL